jgi:hypothetical protein
MTEREDDKMTDYLWDPSAPEDADVRAVEQQLQPLRFDPSAHPLKLSPRSSRRRSAMGVGWKLAAAAAIVIATGYGFSQWRFTWPSGRPWSVSGQSAAASSQLEVGGTLEVPPSGQALVDVARIGTMRVAGGSRVTLRSTQGTRHRLGIETGQVHVRVWAPPGSVAFQTPTGEVVDMGCEFDLHVEADVSRLQVRSGWVQMENTLGESLIPAGASGEMRRDLLPGVPVFDNAGPSFLAAVRQLERTGDAASLRSVLDLARARDVLTLLMLIARRTPGTDELAARAAELSPPPGGVTVGQVARGDHDALWRWRDSLGLPPEKGWLRNWKDALPRWGGLP